MSNPAEAADPHQARATYLATLRHELRTPLNAIIGYSEMLLEDAPDAMPTAVEPLQHVRSGGKTLLEMVNSVLDKTRLAAGEALDSLAPLLCRQMRDPLASVFQHVNVLLDGGAISVDLLEDLGKIREAAVRLQAQLDGMASHLAAGPAAPPPKPTADQAPGMEDYVAFMQPADNAARRPDAEPGRILAVDDIEANREVLARRLQREGHTVTVAAGGKEALALARQQPFDLILLDILMPEMSGLEVLTQLKADEQLRHIPVVMISALDEMSSVVRSIEIGAEDYLPKPFEPALLKARVGACLEKKRLRDREVQHLQQIEAERNRADALLHVILPAQVVQELKATNEVKPRRFDNVAIMFSDIVGFTPYCEKHQPEEIVANLQRMIVAFEEFALEYRIQKIKTIGDSFMAACGLLDPVENPVLNCIRCAVRMIEEARRSDACWEVRVGINVGSVVAGLLGQRQYLFDLWGDTVNTAARMESHGVASGVTLSESAWKAVEQVCRCDSRGVVHVKGKGDQPMYLFKEFR